MADGYKIRSHALLNGMKILILMPEDDQEDFLEVLERDPKQHDRVHLIQRTLEKLYERGIAASIKGHHIRFLKNCASLAEIAVLGKVIRVMVYINRDEQSDPKPVLLFDFDGHQGSDKIPGNLREKGKRLAAIARLCMEEE